MGDIKIDETSFYFFINSVDLYIKNSINHVSKEVKENGLFIMNSVEKYQEIAQLKMMRKSYYGFYVTNRKSYPVEANKAYQHYLKIKEKLNKMDV